MGYDIRTIAAGNAGIKERYQWRFAEHMNRNKVKTHGSDSMIRSRTTQWELMSQNDA